MIEYTGAVKPPVREFGKRDSGRLETGMSVLIIDEWMRYPLSEMESRDVLEIADARYHKGSTILCSQFDVPGWVEQVPNKLTADAICDRYAHDSHKIIIEGDDSMRKRKSTIQ